MTIGPNPLSAGTQIRALDYPPSQFNYDESNILNITSTSWLVGSPEVSVRFRAPTTGRVGVTLSATVRNNAVNAERLFVGFRIMSGDPADNDTFQPVSAKYGRSNLAYADANNGATAGGQLTIVTGLTPGDWYYAQTQYRVTLGSGTADLLYRSILVIPVP